MTDWFEAQHLGIPAEADRDVLLFPDVYTTTGWWKAAVPRVLRTRELPRYRYWTGRPPHSRGCLRRIARGGEDAVETRRGLATAERGHRACWLPMMQADLRPARRRRCLSATGNGDRLGGTHGVMGIEHRSFDEDIDLKRPPNRSRIELSHQRRRRTITPSAACSDDAEGTGSVRSTPPAVRMAGWFSYKAELLWQGDNLDHSSGRRGDGERRVCCARSFLPEQFATLPGNLHRSKLAALAWDRPGRSRRRRRRDRSRSLVGGRGPVRALPGAALDEPPSPHWGGSGGNDAQDPEHSRAVGTVSLTAGARDEALAVRRSSKCQRSGRIVCRRAPPPFRRLARLSPAGGSPSQVAALVFRGRQIRSDATPTSAASAPTPPSKSVAGCRPRRASREQGARLDALAGRLGGEPRLVEAGFDVVSGWSASRSAANDRGSGLFSIATIRLTQSGYGRFRRS